MNKQSKVQNGSDANDDVVRKILGPKLKKAEKLNSELDSLERLESEEKKRVERLRMELDSLEDFELEERKRAAKLMSEIDSLELEKKKKLEEQDGDIEFGDHNEKEIAEAKRRHDKWLGF